MPEMIFGQNPVMEALRTSLLIEKIWVVEKTGGAKINEIISSAEKRGIQIHYVSRKRLGELTGGAKTQGVLAFVQSRSYSTVDAILAKSRHLKEAPLVALLDGIEDPHNLGAILRAADGAGVHGVILPKRRSVGLTSTVAKTSAGASLHVSTAQVSNLNYTLEKLRAENIWILGADQNADQVYYDADLSVPLGIVIGAEGRGLHRLVREKCDFLVRIPMYGAVNSLNASVAAALLFFEARRQRLAHGQ